MAIKIDIGSQTDLGAFTKLIDALDSVKASIGGVQQQARASTSAYTGGSGRGSKPAGAGGAGGAAPMSPLDVYRYFDAANKASGGGFQKQRDDALRNAFADAQQRYQASGDPAALRQMQALSGQIGRLNQGFARHLGGLIGSTRLNFGGQGGGAGASPLVGRLLGVLGKGGPVGIAAAVLASAFLAVAKAASAAVDRLQAFTSNMLEANTTAETNQQLSRASSALGGNAAQMSRQLRDALEGSGIAKMEAARAGVSPIKDPFGRTDFGADFIRVLKQIAYATPEEARRLAQVYGAPDLARVNMLSDAAKNRMFDTMGSGPSEKSQKAAQEFTFWLAEAKRVGGEFVREFGSQFLKGLTNAMQLISRFAGFLTGFADKIAALIKGGGLAGFIYDQILGGSESGKGRVERAVEANTKAIQMNTRALGDARGVFGGGARAQRAVPSSVKGMYFNQAAYRAALSTGLL